MSVTNQKHVTVYKQQSADKGKGKLIAVRGKSQEQFAARTLSPSAFKVWLYITSNRNGYDFDLYAVDVEATYGVKPRSYSNAIKELEVAGYLVPKNDGQKRYYYFFDYPQKTENNAIRIEVCKSSEVPPVTLGEFEF